MTNASLFLVLSDYSHILFFFFGVLICFIVLQLYFLLSFFPVLPPLFSTSSLPSSPPPPSLRPPYHSAPDWLHLLPPQGGPTAAVTGHCCCRTGGPQASIPHHCKVCGRGQRSQALTNIFISDVQSESTTASVKLLALISIGETGRRRWAGTCRWGHLRVVHVVLGSLLATCFSVLCVVPCTVE